MSISTFQRHVTNGSLPKSLKLVFYRVGYNRNLIKIIEQAKQKRYTTQHKKKTFSRKNGQNFSFSHEAYEVKNPSCDSSNRIKNYVFFYECSGITNALRGV